MPGLIVHEWIERRGGSENVVEAIADTFPDAPILTPWSNAPERFAGHRVIESRLSRTPIRRSKPLAALVLPAAWRTMVPRGRSFDWVLASSHLFSHHVQARGTDGPATKFVYVHSPARYVWNPDLDARGSSPLARAASSVLKPLDRRRAREAQFIAANSEFVRRRVEQTWQRESIVIHPPVDLQRMRDLAEAHDGLLGEERRVLEQLPEQFFLGASRFVSYKQLDQVIDVGESVGVPVVLAGGGPEEASLRRRAERAEIPVTFAIEPSDVLLAALFRRATALVFLAVEDFGIMPVEAMAVGTPVLARPAGGILETVREGVSGAFLTTTSPKEVRAALERVTRLDRLEVARHADAFSTGAFQRKIREWVKAGTR